MCLGDWWRALEARPVSHPSAADIHGVFDHDFLDRQLDSCVWLQRLIYGRRIAATEIKEPPIFIIGHWRSGTTYLHELMVCDERFAYPDVLRMLRAEPFSGDRLVRSHVAVAAAARQTADGQHGDRLASAAGRRIRPGGDGRPDAVLPDGVSRTIRRRTTNSSTWRAAIRQDLDRWRRDIKRFVQMLTLTKRASG